MIEQNKMEKEKISKLLFSLAIPSIVAQLVNILYNIVDRIYIGQMANGTTAMAALSVCLPIITFISAFTMLLGTGGAPLCAIRLGEKKNDKAEEIMTNSFSLLLISGILLTLFILLFHQPLLYLFGANEETISMAISYITIYALGTVFVQITLGMNAYINTQGFAKMGMMTVLIGAIFNIVLDPLFIFGLDMGVSGAALATILSQGISALWVLRFLFSKQSLIKLRREYCKPKKKIVLSIMALGISPFIMNATESLLQISFNNQLSLYGGTIAVAAMAILNSLWQFITLPLQGLCQGAQPILSYNYGAKNYARVRETFQLLFKLCLGLSLVVGLSMIIFSQFFVSLFTIDKDTIAFTSWALRIFLLGATLFGAQIACQQSFMALGQAKISLTMAIFRKIILLIPFIYLFPILLENQTIFSFLTNTITSYVHDASKVFAVLLAEPVSDIIAALTTSYTFYRFYKKNLYKEDKKL